MMLFRRVALKTRKRYKAVYLHELFDLDKRYIA